MVEIRYKDKHYLTKYDLDVALFEKFQIEVDDVIPIRKIFVLNTNKGRKVLKRIDYPVEQLDFINHALQYIQSRNFHRIIQFEKTKEGEIYTPWRGSNYCIMDLMGGRECEFSNPIDVSIASKAIAALHLASEGFRYKGNRIRHTHNKYICGQLIDIFKKKRNEICFFKSIANLYEHKSEFDKIFLEHVEYYEKQMEESIRILEESQYFRLCGEEDKIALCHHDLAHHNILIHEGEAYFVDFDYAVIDLRVHDLCNYINKVVKNFAFDIEKARGILEDYCSVNPLDQRELVVLYGMLSFPEDFYSIVRDHYTRKKEWDEAVFLYRLNKKVGYKEDRKEFLTSFKETIKNPHF